MCDNKRDTYLKTPGQIAKKWTKIFQKNVKIKSPYFWQNYFFPESYTIELIKNGNSTHESKYIKNCMRPNFMWCEKIILYVTMPKWSDNRLPIF